MLLIDNKATERSLGKSYKLSDNERLLYCTHHMHLHLIPEIIDGVVKQSMTVQVMYIQLVAKVLQFICDKYKECLERRNILFVHWV